MLTEGEQGWHERIALFSSFALQDVMHFSHLILPNVAGRLAVELQHERESHPGAFLTADNIDALDIKSNAPTPSTDITVASGSKSVSPWKRWEIDSQPDRVDRACWCGAVAVLNASPKLWAVVRATKRRKISPTTMPRTPPVRFLKAVIRPMRKGPAITSGICALANSCANSQQVAVLPDCTSTETSGRWSSQKDLPPHLSWTSSNCARTTRCST